MAGPTHRSEAVAVLSVHASPVGDLGRADNGGMNLAVRVLCEGLAAQGIPTDVFTRLEDPSDPREEMIAPLSRLVRLEVGPARHLATGQLPTLLGGLADAVIAHARSERRSYGLVHGHYWLSGVVAERLRSAWRIPWLQSFHTLGRTKAAAGLPVAAGRAAVEARLVGAADRLVAMSRSEEADLLTLYGADPNRICVVQPGVHLADYHSPDTARLRTRLGLDGHRTVLWAGRLEPLKGVDLLLEAMARLALDGRFDDVVTLLAGADSGAGAGERARLEALAVRLGIEDRVRFLGAVPHELLGGYMALADVCAVPSRSETFGLVALEAQAAGTPVVAAAVGGLREIVVDGVTGRLVPRTREGFADAIGGLLHDPARRARMGTAARLRAADFSWGRAADRLSTVYRQALDPQLEAAPCALVD